MDTKNWMLWHTVFANDVVGTFDNAVPVGVDDAPASQTWDGAESLVSSIRATIGECITVHHGHTPEVSLTSATSATGIWAIADIVEFPSGHVLHGAGHYLQTYTRIDGNCHIQSIHLTRTRMTFSSAADPAHRRVAG
ncbi:DUF4440 domain-containing protein [Mycobacteroides abscessus]|nr:DUF4440 domain-containing protein [Mycobacteroides abscessus]